MRNKTEKPPEGADFMRFRGKVVWCMWKGCVILKRRVSALMLLIAIATGGYFGWQWKQTKDYFAQATPLYRNCESIEQDLNKVFDKGGRYIDLMDESKRISTATKELKARFSEFAPPTDASRETKVAFSAMLTAQIDRADAYLNSFKPI